MTTNVNIHDVVAIKIENRSTEFSLESDSKLLWTNIEITDSNGNRTSLSLHGDCVKQIPITMV